MRGLLLPLLVCLGACGQSPLLHHLNAADLKLSSTTTQKPEGCDVTFAQLGLCGQVRFIAGPRMKGETALVLRLKDIATNQPLAEDLQVGAYNSMPDMGHEGFDMTVTPLTENGEVGAYRISQPCCVMRGRWVVALKIHSFRGDDEAAYEFVAR